MSIENAQISGPYIDGQTSCNAESFLQDNLIQLQNYPDNDMEFLARLDQRRKHCATVVEYICYSIIKFTDLRRSSEASSMSFQLRAGTLNNLLASHDNFENIDHIINFLNLHGFQKSSERIAYLQSTDDMEEGDKPLSLDSARGFVSFIRKFRDLGEPLLGLFSQGTLSAGWRIADNKHLLVEFLERDSASFAMISPDETVPDKKFRLNGHGTCQQVINALYREGVDKWKD